MLLHIPTSHRMRIFPFSNKLVKYISVLNKSIQQNKYFKHTFLVDFHNVIVPAPKLIGAKVLYQDSIFNALSEGKHP